MNYRTHQIGGVCTGIAVGRILAPAPYNNESLFFIGIVTVASAFGSLLPDIDEPNSKIGQKVKIISGLIKSTFGHRGLMHSLLMTVLLFISLELSRKRFFLDYNNEITLVTYGLMALGLTTLIVKTFHYKKKGLAKWTTISIIMCILILLKVYIPITHGTYLEWCIIGLITGYLSHLFLDSLTESGVPLLYPFFKFRFRLMKLRTGRHEWLGQLIIVSLTTACTVYFCGSMYTDWTNKLYVLLFSFF